MKQKQSTKRNDFKRPQLFYAKHKGNVYYQDQHFKLKMEPKIVMEALYHLLWIYFHLIVTPKAIKNKDSAIFHFEVFHYILL